MVETSGLMGTVDVAVVGCGEHMIETLGPALRTTPGLRVSSACDIDLERARQVASLLSADAAYTTVDEMLAARLPDAIVAAGPPSLHRDVAERALPTGIGLFLEKPAAADAATVKALAALADRYGNVTQVGHNLRHSAAWSVVTSLAADPAFGQVASLQLSYLASRPRGTRWGLPALRSFLLTHAVHPVDLALSVLGRPVETHARIRMIEAGGMILTVHLTFASDQTAMIVAGTAAPNLKLHATLIGDESQVIEMHGLHRVTSTLTAAVESGVFRASTDWAVRTLESGSATAGYCAELAVFRDAIAGHSRAAPSLPDVATTYEVLEAIAQAADPREPIAVGP